MDWIFGTESFMARWHCGTQDPFWGWVHILSDVFVSAAYIGLSGAVFRASKLQVDPRFSRLLVLFSAFLVACAIGHALDAAVWWWPAYNLLTLSKTLTCTVSWAALIYLVCRRRWLSKFAPPSVHTDLSTRAQMFEQVYTHAPVMINAWRDSEPVLWNPQCERILGYSLQDVQNLQDVHATFYPNYQDREHSRVHVAEASGTFKIFLVTTRSGEKRHQMWANFPAGNGTVVGVGVDVDKEVDERRTLEVTVLQLRQANTELEQFAYVASHDLQEPLRKIVAHGNRVRRSWASFREAAERGDHVEAQVQLDRVEDSLERQESAASRMRVLIEDLLELSRALRREKAFEEVDINGILQSLSDMFAETLLESGGTIEIACAGLPSVRATHSDLKRVLQNLTSNSLKFTHSGRQPVVKIDAVVTGAHLSISVSDNGIGFPPEKAEEILQAFKRLHPRSRYEGTGLGLSICRNLVEGFGGRLKAIGKEGEGATFTFTVPLFLPPEDKADGPED